MAIRSSGIISSSPAFNRLRRRLMRASSSAAADRPEASREGGSFTSQRWEIKHQALKAASISTSAPPYLLPAFGSNARLLTFGLSQKMIRHQFRLNESEGCDIDYCVATLAHPIGRNTPEFDQRRQDLNDQQRQGHFGPAAISAVLPCHEFVVLADLEHITLSGVCPTRPVCSLIAIARLTSPHDIVVPPRRYCEGSIDCCRSRGKIIRSRQHRSVRPTRLGASPLR